MQEQEPWPRSDGVVILRPPETGDAASLIAGRDEEWSRWLGPGSPEPCPTACILVGSKIVGWVDYDNNQLWLKPHEVNVGYNVFADCRRNGYATRGVRLLLDFLRAHSEADRAYLDINAQNVASLGVARSVGALACERTSYDSGKVCIRYVVDLRR